MSIGQTVERELPVPATQAAVFGVLAYAVGVVLTFLLEGDGKSEQFTQGAELGAGGSMPGLTPPSDFEISGMLYHVAHVGVDLTVTASARGQSMSMGIGGDMLEEQYLMAIPPLVLAVAGYLLASRQTAAPDSFVRAGAAVAVGYVLAMALGSLFVFAWGDTVEVSSAFQSVSATVSMGPDVLTSLLFGAGYAVAFGGLGGHLAEERTDGSAADVRDEPTADRPDADERTGGPA